MYVCQVMAGVLLLFFLTKLTETLGNSVPAEGWSSSLFILSAKLRYRLTGLCKRAKRLILRFSVSVAFQTSPKLHQHRNE